MSQFIEMLQSSKTKMPLESVCSYMGKGISPKYVDVSTVATVNQACVHWDGQRLENVKYHNADIAVKKRTLQEGDVLLNATGNGTLGRSCVFHCPTDNKTYINDGHVIALSTNRSVIYPEVLNVYFSLPDTQGEIYRQYVTGSTNQVDIVFTDIKKMMIPIPPMELQTKFVNIMEQADKSEFDEFKSQFIEMFGSVDDNPKSYDIKKVGDFAECFAGATPSTKISSYWDNGNIPWMSSGEVHKVRVQDTDAKITQQGYDGCSTKMVPIHSIVIALAGQGKTRGTVAINDIELCTNQSLCAIVPNEEVNYEYLFHNLRGRYKELRSMSGDVDGRGGLNLKHIQSIRVIVPPMSEQMKFVSIARQADKSESDILYGITSLTKNIKTIYNGIL